MSDAIGVCGVLMILALVFVAGMAAGKESGRKEVRAEAIEAGVAEYHVDAKTGKVTFVWKTVTP